MKKCKKFFNKLLIIEDAAEFAKLRTRSVSVSYGFALITCDNRDYTTQRIYRFTEDFDAAYKWLMNNNMQGGEDIYGVVCGVDL